jgi:hypothetical protein
MIKRNGPFTGIIKFDIVIVIVLSNKTMSEGTSDDVRALLGSLCMVFGVVIFWSCAYHLISCLKKKEDARGRRLNIYPKEQSLNDLI